MNIQGVLLLKKMGLPERFVHFNIISEIPSEFLEEIGEKRKYFNYGV